MKKSKQLASLALAVMTLAGTSAFAESRHSKETSARGEARASREARTSRGESRGSRGESRGVVRRSTPAGGQVTVEGRRPARVYESRESRDRSRDRNRDESRYRSNDRYRSSGDRFRNDGRFENDHRFRNDGRFEAGRGRYSNREPYYAHGRISRCTRYGGGYRVWVHGSPYPFYVPLAYWNADRFRVGLTIGLGGYYNPLGYYDYWDGYRDGYSRNRGNRRYSTPDFIGVVERVDYRRDTFVVRDDETGDFITVVLRDRNEDLPRRGDVVAVRGDWTTRGYFRAYDIDFLD